MTFYVIQTKVSQHVDPLKRVKQLVKTQIWMVLLVKRSVSVNAFANQALFVQQTENALKQRNASPLSVGLMQVTKNADLAAGISHALNQATSIRFAQQCAKKVVSVSKDLYET